MRFDQGSNDRQRRLAANEDAACAISEGWVEGDREQANIWQLWLAQHVISRERFWELIGITPAQSIDHLPFMGRPLAISEYNHRTSDITAWVALADGSVLAGATYGVYWHIPANDAIPVVTLADPDGTQLAMTPGAERSPCCGAPTRVRLPAGVLRSTLVVVAPDSPSEALGRIPIERYCSQCRSVLHG